MVAREEEWLLLFIYFSSTLFIHMHTHIQWIQVEEVNKKSSQAITIRISSLPLAEFAVDKVHFDFMHSGFGLAFFLAYYWVQMGFLHINDSVDIKVQRKNLNPLPWPFDNWIVKFCVVIAFVHSTMRKKHISKQLCAILQFLRLLFHSQHLNIQNPFDF